VGAHVHIKHGAVQIIALVLLGNHRLLNGIHAADRGAIGIIAFVHVPGADALEPGDFFWLPAVFGLPFDMTRGRARGGQNPLKLHGGDHVGEFGVLVIVEFGGVKGGKARRQNHGPDVDGVDLFFLIKINRIRRAKLFAGAALAFLNVNATVAVNAIFQRNCLGIFDKGRFALDEPHIVFIDNFFGAFFSTGATGNAFGFIDVSGMLDEFDLKVACFARNPVNFA